MSAKLLFRPPELVWPGAAELGSDRLAVMIEAGVYDRLAPAPRSTP